MANNTDAATPVQLAWTSAITLPNITRERIDIGLVAVGGDLGAHISQEDSLENDPPRV